VTEEALYLGIERAAHRRAGLGHRLPVQRHVEAHGFSVVRSSSGHGVGHALHEEPQVPNFGPAGAAAADGGHDASHRADGGDGQGGGEGLGDG